jgi:hypothetical protein
VDVLKHSSLAKFNDIRPGVYREFFRYLPEPSAPCATPACPAFSWHSPLNARTTH